jgi:hypothetical protein
VLRRSRSELGTAAGRERVQAGSSLSGDHGAYYVGGRTPLAPWRGNTSRSYR